MEAVRTVCWTSAAIIMSFRFSSPHTQHTFHPFYTYLFIQVFLVLQRQLDGLGKCENVQHPVPSDNFAWIKNSRQLKSQRFKCREVHWFSIEKKLSLVTIYTTRLYTVQFSWKNNWPANDKPTISTLYSTSLENRNQLQRKKHSREHTHTQTSRSSSNTNSQWRAFCYDEGLQNHRDWLRLRTQMLRIATNCDNSMIIITTTTSD